MIGIIIAILLAALAYWVCLAIGLPAEGIGLLRVDCWAGGDRRLVSYYASEGFTPTQEIEVRPGTSVQTFEWRPAS